MAEFKQQYHFHPDILDGVSDDRTFFTADLRLVKGGPTISGQRMYDLSMIQCALDNWTWQTRSAAAHLAELQERIRKFHEQYHDD